MEQRWERGSADEEGAERGEGWFVSDDRDQISARQERGSHDLWWHSTREGRDDLDGAEEVDAV